MSTFIFCLIFVQVCIFFIAGFVLLAAFFGAGRNVIAMGETLEPEMAVAPVTRKRQTLLTPSELAYFWK